MKEFIAKLRTCLVEDTKECLLAWWRYTLYYSWWDGFLAKTIRDQFKWRMDIMEKACYENGSCQRCGERGKMEPIYKWRGNCFY